MAILHPTAAVAHMARPQRHGRLVSALCTLLVLVLLAVAVGTLPQVCLADEDASGVGELGDEQAAVRARQGTQTGAVDGDGAGTQAVADEARGEDAAAVAAETEAEAVAGAEGEASKESAVAGEAETMEDAVVEAAVVKSTDSEPAVEAEEDFAVDAVEEDEATAEESTSQIETGAVAEGPTVEPGSKSVMEDAESGAEELTTEVDAAPFIKDSTSEAPADEAESESVQQEAKDESTVEEPATPVDADTGAKASAVDIEAESVTEESASAAEEHAREVHISAEESASEVAIEEEDEEPEAETESVQEAAEAERGVEEVVTESEADVEAEDVANEEFHEMEVEEEEVDEDMMAEEGAELELEEEEEHAEDFDSVASDTVEMEEEPELVTVGIKWRAPFWSNSPYSREAHGLVAALEKQENVLVRTQQFPEPISLAHAATLSRFKATRLLESTNLTGAGHEHQIVVCHSDPTQWGVPTNRGKCPPDADEVESADEPLPRRVIGRCAAPHDEITDDWEGHLRMVDEVWVPSVQDKNNILSLGLPSDSVQVIPPIVHTCPDEEPLSPKHLLPTSTENSFAIVAFLPRWDELEGTDVLVEAYLNAFSHTDDVLLVIVCDEFTNTNDLHDRVLIDSGLLSSLNMTLDKIPPFHVIPRVLDGEIHSLFHRADLLVSPVRTQAVHHRTRQAMGCGVPVVLTGWAADTLGVQDTRTVVFPIEYILETTAEQHERAHPSKTHLATVFQTAAQKPPQLEQVAESAKVFVEGAYNEDTIAQMMLERLRPQS